MAINVVKPNRAQTPWYVVFTKPNQESVALRNLENQGYRAWLPTLAKWQCTRGQWTCAETAMFPRYLFVRPGRPEQGLGPVRSTLGVTSLVRFGNSPATINEDVLAQIRQIVATEQQSPDQRLPFATGDGVRVVSGPFAGLQGIVKRSAMMRVSILVSLLGRENEVTLAPSGLRKVG